MRPLIFLFFFSFSSSIWAGNFVGNGGDSVSFEFIRTAREIILNLKKMQISPKTHEIVLKLGQAINETTVLSKERLFLNQTEVEAINYPNKKLIEVSRSRWGKMKVDLKSRFTFVLHEYLYIAGVNDDSYFFSQSFISILDPQFFAHFIDLTSYVEQLNQLRNKIDFLMRAKTTSAEFCLMTGEIKIISDQVEKYFKINSSQFKKADVSLARHRKINDVSIRLVNHCLASKDSKSLESKALLSAIDSIDLLLLDLNSEN